MDVLDGNLKAIEALGFRQCDLRRKVAAEVFIDNAIRCSKEGKYARDEVVFIVSEAVPVCSVGFKVDLFGGPKGGFGFLVHLPDVIVLDGKKDKMVASYSEKWFRGGESFLSGNLVP